MKLYLLLKDVSKIFYLIDRYTDDKDRWSGKRNFSNERVSLNT